MRLWRGWGMASALTRTKQELSTSHLGEGGTSGTTKYNSQQLQQLQSGTHKQSRMHSLAQPAVAAVPTTGGWGWPPSLAAPAPAPALAPAASAPGPPPAPAPAGPAPACLLPPARTPPPATLPPPVARTWRGGGWWLLWRRPQPRPRVRRWPWGGAGGRTAARGGGWPRPPWPAGAAGRPASAVGAWGAVWQRKCNCIARCSKLHGAHGAVGVW